MEHTHLSDVDVIVLCCPHVLSMHSISCFVMLMCFLAFICHSFETFAVIFTEIDVGLDQKDVDLQHIFSSLMQLTSVLRLASRF